MDGESERRRHQIKKQGPSDGGMNNFSFLFGPEPMVCTGRLTIITTSYLEGIRALRASEYWAWSVLGIPFGWHYDDHDAVTTHRFCICKFLVWIPNFESGLNARQRLWQLAILVSCNGWPRTLFCTEHREEREQGSANRPRIVLVNQ